MKYKSAKVFKFIFAYFIGFLFLNTAQANIWVIEENPRTSYSYRLCSTEPIPTEKLMMCYGINAIINVKIIGEITPTKKRLLKFVPDIRNEAKIMQLVNFILGHSPYEIRFSVESIACLAKTSDRIARIYVRITEQ